MTDKPPPKPLSKPLSKPPGAKAKPHTALKPRGGPPQNKADHAAFKRGDRFVSKPMRIKH